MSAIDAPLSVYLLADHLDGALAAGEDLVARGHDWRTLAENPGEPAEFASRQRKIAEDVPDVVRHDERVIAAYLGRPTNTDQEQPAAE